MHIQVSKNCNLHCNLCMSNWIGLFIEASKGYLVQLNFQNCACLWLRQLRRCVPRLQMQIVVYIVILLALGMFYKWGKFHRRFFKHKNSWETGKIVANPRENSVCCSLPSILNFCKTTEPFGIEKRGEDLQLDGLGDSLVGKCQDHQFVY